jgi:hypothetical protein
LVVEAGEALEFAERLRDRYQGLSLPLSHAVHTASKFLEALSSRLNTFPAHSALLHFFSRGDTCCRYW